MKDKDTILLENLYGMIKEANLASDENLKETLSFILKQKQIEESNLIYKWFMTQYLKWFKSPDKDNEKPIQKHTYQEGEPEWMSREGIMDFTKFEDSQIQKINHLIDFLKTYNEVDLKSLYKEPYNIIQDKILQWETQLSKKVEKNKVSPLKEGEDFKVIYNIKDATGRPVKWVKLLSKKACEFEGNSMGHCAGGYEPEYLISLYDENNLPHVTLEIDGKEIHQIKGKQNAAPVEKYIPPTLEFIKKSGYNVISDGENIGMIKTDDGVYVFRDSKQGKKILENDRILSQKESKEINLKIDKNGVCSVDISIQSKYFPVDLSNLNICKRNIYAFFIKNIDLRNLQTCGGSINAEYAQNVDLRSLQTCGSIIARSAQNIDLKNLQTCRGSINAEYAQSLDLRNLQTCGGSILAHSAQNVDLSNFQSCGGDIKVGSAQNVDLRNLQTCGGSILARSAQKIIIPKQFKNKLRYVPKNCEIIHPEDERVKMESFKSFFNRITI